MIKTFIRRTFKLYMQKVVDHHMSAYAAQASYFIMMSAFPFCILLIMFIQQSPIEYSVLKQVMNEMAPGFVTSILTDVLSEAYLKRIKLITSLSILFILWASGRGMMSIRNGLNQIYHHKETKNYLHVRLLSTLYALILAVVLLFMIGLIIFGKEVYRKIGTLFPLLSFLKQFFLFSFSIRILILFVLMSCLFLYIYRVFPEYHMRLLYLLPGAMSCSGAWIVTTIIFSLYFSSSTNFSSTYGSLAAIMMLMLWLYVCMFEVLLCGQLNCLLHPFGKPFKYSVFFTDEFKKL